MAFLTLTGCAQHKLDRYEKLTPVMDIQSYFNGPIKAWGIVQNWKGETIRRFDVTMHGTWEGPVGTLKEDFIYDDGEKQHRTWTITKLPNGEYEGRASDILNKAVGQTKGNAARWKYEMNLPVGGTTYHVTFDDWMWMVDDKTLVNRSYIKKFGITVAELTLFMQKQK